MGMYPKSDAEAAKIETVEIKKVWHSYVQSGSDTT